jgi:hypothetical protein
MNLSLMVKTLFSASLVAIASLLAAVPAHAISFTWQFTPDSGPTGANPYVVKGTIDGLAIGSNSGVGLTATVTDTPTGQLLGTYFFVGTGLGADAFTVDAGGNVTFADAVFTGGDVALFSGGYGGFTPQLVDDAAGTPDWNSSGQTTFSSAPTAVPFDFSPTPAVVILGGIFAAKKLRNKLVKK